jgi:predicted DNA-binding antitoxin AbrB/MazE fold protein
MEQFVIATFEGGVFRPKSPVELPEGAEVRILIPSNSDKKLMNREERMRFLESLWKIPPEPGGIEFSGRDHDSILYGKRDC